jgi:hypothetical protein
MCHPPAVCAAAALLPPPGHPGHPPPAHPPARCCLLLRSLRRVLYYPLTLFAPACSALYLTQVHKYNLEHPEEAVTVTQGPVPEPGQGQVLVRLQLRPVNPADLFSCQGGWVGGWGRVSRQVQPDGAASAAMHWARVGK